MTRALGLAVGLLQIVFNLVGVAALATALIGTALQGHWLTVGQGLAAGAMGAVGLALAGLGLESAIWAGDGAPNTGPTGLALQLASLALTATWTWALFTHFPVPAPAPSWLNALLLYALAAVAAQVAGVVQFGRAASARPERTSLAAINTLACHVFSAVAAACMFLGHGDAVAWTVAAAVVPTGAVKLILARELTTAA